MKRPVVTVMFHSVGLHDHRWAYAHIAESPGSFEGKLAALRQSGFQTLTMAEAAAHTATSHGSSARRILLTLDDGYCDNWVYAYPLLMKYKMMATIFLTPTFVDPRPVVRPKSEDSEVIEDVAGFLSWEEIREMEKSGLIEIQSHALTHTWYFSGPDVVDYWHPGAATEAGGPVWMLWNTFEQLKPFYLRNAAEYESRIPYGTPIYTHGKALEVHRYTPNEPILLERLVGRVVQGGGPSFFQHPDWRQQLDMIVHETRNSYPPQGYWEMDEEYRRRVFHELTESKRIIERKLDKDVYGICWPGGGVTEEVVELARQAGYRYFTLPSRWKGTCARGPFQGMLPRMSSVPRVRWRNRDLGEPSGREFLWMVERERGSKWAGLPIRAAKLVRLICNLR